MSADDRGEAQRSGDEPLEREAYRLLGRLETGDLPDEDLARLAEISAELDRRGVTYRGRW